MGILANTLAKESSYTLQSFKGCQLAVNNFWEQDETGFDIEKTKTLLFN